MSRAFYVVEAERAGCRLDAFLAEASGLTRSRVENLIREGNAALDGAVELKPGRALRAGQEAALEVPEARPCALEKQDIPIDIIYQDADLAVVYKPSGMVVHPGSGNWDGTLANALLARLDRLSGIGGEMRPGILHRIDKDTSGLLLVAKNDRAHVALAEQIKAHTLDRAYLAIVGGRLNPPEGEVNAPIGRHPADRVKMAVVSGGREALTRYRTLAELREATYMEARLSTGRTHQIRVHMAHLGHPVLGDPLYGPKKPRYRVEGGQLLHARELGFTHPTTGERMVFTAEPERRFLEWLEKLKI